MGALEREVGGGMIELRAIELHDVGLAALVFRVAGAALADPGVGSCGRESRGCVAHVRRDVLVAIEAQRGLACGRCVRSWQLPQVSSCFTCARVTLPGISSVSTEAANALESASNDRAVIHATPRVL